MRFLICLFFTMLIMPHRALAAVNSADQACGSEVSDDDIRACVADELRDSDERINAVYGMLMATKNDADKLALRNEQRAWLKTRDKTCHLDHNQSDREAWLKAILSDQAKTICVVRFTFSRVYDLNDQLSKDDVSGDQKSNAPQAPQFVPQSANTNYHLPDNLTTLDEGYQVLSNARHDRGKWYFEVKIKSADIASLGDMLINVGVSNFDVPADGVLHNVNIRHNHVYQESQSLGFAIDLDNGGVYSRSNGIWTVAPGTTGGAQLKLNRDYAFYIVGSSSIEELLKRNIISINLGEAPFLYAIPDGYQPFSPQ